MGMNRMGNIHDSKAVLHCNSEFMYHIRGMSANNMSSQYVIGSCVSHDFYHSGYLSHCMSLTKSSILKSSYPDRETFILRLLLCEANTAKLRDCKNTIRH